MTYHRETPDILKSKREITDLFTNSDLGRPVEIEFSGDVLNFCSSTRYAGAIRHTSISPELQGYLPHFESRLTLCHD